MIERKRRFPVPRPSWLSLTVAIVVVAVLAIVTWVPYQYEQAAMKAISASGGLYKAESVAPSWLQKLGERFQIKMFDRITQIDCTDDDIENDDLEAITRCD